MLGLQNSLLQQCLLGGFSPADISGLVGWWSADYGVLNAVGPDVAATAGQSVRRWLDRSGNGNHFEQATGLKQPLFSGGRLVFDGANAGMSCVPTPAIEQPATILVRVQVEEYDIGTPQSIVRGFNTPRIFCQDYSRHAVVSGGGVEVISTGSSILGLDTVILTKWNGINSYIEANGYSAAGDLGLNGTINEWFLGSVENSYFYLKGSIKKVLWFNRILNATEMNQVKGYMEL
jgi:hypothetical protein